MMTHQLVAAGCWSPPSIHCIGCNELLPEAKLNPKFDFVNGVVGITCCLCKQMNWTCQVCAKAWKTGRNNRMHFESKSHQHMVIQQHQSSNAQIMTPVRNSSDNSNGDSDFYFPDCQQSPLEESTINIEETTTTCDDWLTSLPNKLGKSVLSLDEIKEGGSFPANSRSPEFYYFESQHPNQGAKYLTAMPFSVEPGLVADEEAEFHLRMTKFLTRLTKVDQEELAYFLLKVCNSTSKDNTLNIFKSTRPPTSTEDFNDFYTKGKNSVSKHLPIPVVMKTQDRSHSYVTLTDVIQNMLAASTAVDQFSFETDLHPNELHGESTLFDGDKPASISTTRAAYSLYLELKNEEVDTDFVLYLWIKRWSDDFDPNNTKQSRNQVWIMTNTICPPAGEKKGRNTFFMAIGQKGDEHSGIEMIFENELSVLSGQGKNFYHGGRREIIRVKAGKVCVCVDRPERASLYQVGDHNGTFSQLWGHAVHVDGQGEDNCLPSCPFCRRHRLEKHLKLGVEFPQCNGVQCVSWNVMDSKFTSAAPFGYPTVFDEREGAPPAPLGREINANSSEKQRLPCIYLTVKWLQEAVVFAHHQLKTQPPNSPARKRYWTKANAVAFLRTCAIGTKLQTAIYDSAQNGEDRPPLPCSWSPGLSLQQNHYAAMHMLFLGHAKSNFEMINKFHLHYKISASVGKQANKYLRDVQALRCSRFFDAQPLSTSSWGTGVWVSENYVFWARAINFFTTLPAILNCKSSGSSKFQDDLRMVLRFSSASIAAVSRIMSEKRTVGDMDNVVKIYLDTMVELDRWIHDTSIDSMQEQPVSNTGVQMNTSAVQTDNSTSAQENSTDVRQQPGSHTGVPVNSTTAHTENSTTAQVNSTAATTVTGKRKKRTKDSYNFCKSNSLGILSAAEAHRYFGPAVLHWEGGWAGERKIQPVKAELGIKRVNADWQYLVLTTLWQQDALSGLIDQLGSKSSSEKDKRRDMEGQLKVYANRAALMDAVASSKPLSAMLATDGSIWMAYRPTTEEFHNDSTKTTSKNWSRSALQLVKLNFNDGLGQLVLNLCWFAPVSVELEEVLTLESTIELKLHADQFLLLLPRLEDDDEYKNMYYTLGSKWTERIRGGSFEHPRLSQELFKDWLPIER